MVNAKRIYKLVFLSLIVFLTACDKNDKQTGGMEFRINEALLGEAVKLDSLGITLNAPKSWLRLPEGMLQDMHNRLQGKTEDRMFQFTPLQFFINHEQGCVLSLSRLHYLPDSSRADFNRMYRASLDQKFANGTIHQTLFFKDGIEMNQLFIQVSGRIIIKLLFEDANGEMFQMDYMVPQEKYKELAESIESSIGTIQREQ